MLFRWGRFTGASGLVLDWKIECDALDDDDWSCIAQLCVPLVRPFGRVSGVPRGGAKLANAFQVHATKNAISTLIVDDVFTTGVSMIRHVHDLGLAADEWKGLVAFSRTYKLPPNVQCFCQINGFAPVAATK